MIFFFVFYFIIFCVEFSPFSPSFVFEKGKNCLFSTKSCKKKIQPHVKREQKFTLWKFSLPFAHKMALSKNCAKIWWVWENSKTHPRSMKREKILFWKEKIEKSSHKKQKKKKTFFYLAEEKNQNNKNKNEMKHNFVCNSTFLQLYFSLVSFSCFEFWFSVTFFLNQHHHYYGCEHIDEKFSGNQSIGDSDRTPTSKLNLFP